MKVSISKENTTSTHSSQPIFAKKGESRFFSQTKQAEQPFFTPNFSRQIAGDHHIPHQPFFQTKSQPVIQAKLTINEPGDQYEQEADSMANKVVQMQHAPDVQTKCAGCGQEEKMQTKTMLQNMGGKEDEQLQSKPTMLKSKSGGSVASPALTSQLNSSKGKGNSLPVATNSFMSQAFGRDFSNVKVHTDSNAIAMNQGLHAQAFTHGSDIYFNKGQYRPESSDGKKLLAHELTHVVQQREGLERKIQKNPAVLILGAAVAAWIAGCSYRAFNMAFEPRYSGKSDKWRHCFASCQIRKCLGSFFNPTSALFTVVVGAIKEVADIFIGEAEWEDFLADLEGSACGNDISGTCEACCNALRP